MTVVTTNGGDGDDGAVLMDVLPVQILTIAIFVVISVISVVMLNMTVVEIVLISLLIESNGATTSYTRFITTFNSTIMLSRRDSIYG